MLQRSHAGKTPAAFSAFGRQIIALLHTVIDATLARSLANKVVEWNAPALLREVRRMAQAVHQCASVDEAKALLRGDVEGGLAVCWLNSALPSPDQMKAMRLAFDRACDQSAMSPGVAFSAYLIATCDILTAPPPPADGI
jgi:hypothetical protein